MSISRDTAKRLTPPQTSVNDLSDELRTKALRPTATVRPHPSDFVTDGHTQTLRK